MKIVLVVERDGSLRCERTWAQSTGLTRATAFAALSRVKRGAWLVEADSAAEARRTVRNATLPCDCETPQCKHGTFGVVLGNNAK